MKHYWRRLRSTFWFWPVLMSASAALAALGTLALDESGAGEVVPEALRIGSPDSARAILTTLVSSIISVTGVVYSMMLVALSFSSTALGPRLLRDFMRRDQLKIHLGFFVSTAVFSLIVLASIDDDVPRLAVLAAIVAALGAFVFLLFFLQQVALGMQADDVVERVADGVRAAMKREYGTSDDEQNADGDDGKIRAPRSGYLATVDHDRIATWAREQDVLVDCHLRPGRFVLAGELLATCENGKVTEDEVDEIRGAFAIEPTRTETQDIEYHVQEIVEIALRALSPGVNDPFTAITCIDTLAALCSEWFGHDRQEDLLRDEDGRPRVKRSGLASKDLLATCFHQIRQAGDGQPAVAIRLVEAIEALGPFGKDDEACRSLGEHLDMLEASTARHDWIESDRRDFDASLGRARRALEAARA